MKILLDECVTKRLKKHLDTFEVFTVRELNLGGTKNGKLMTFCVENNFDILFSKVKYTQVDDENFKIECNERYKEMYKKDMPDNVFNDIIKGFQFIYILGVKTIPKE